MLETVLIGGIVGVLVAVTILLFVTKQYQRLLERLAVRQEGWERAQEAREQQWRLQQERRTSELEKKLSAQVQQVKDDWQSWTEQDATRIAQLQEQFQAATVRGNIEHELAHLPQTGEAALPSCDTLRTDAHYSQAARLSNADLSGRDLSRRFLANADLRGARLVNANLFMADLTGASLVKADLTNADLSGANLSGADLRDAILVGANLLVTDMNNTLLLGADLRNVRNLTMEQLNSATYNRATQCDVVPDDTMPRIPRVLTRTVLSPLSTSPESPPETALTLPMTPLPPDTTPSHNSQHHHEKRNGHNGRRYMKVG